MQPLISPKNLKMFITSLRLTGAILFPESPRRQLKIDTFVVAHSFKKSLTAKLASPFLTHLHTKEPYLMKTQSFDKFINVTVVAFLASCTVLILTLAAMLITEMFGL